MSVTRRNFFTRAGAIAVAQGLALKGQQAPPPQVPTPPGQRADPRLGTGDAAKYFRYLDRRSTVSLIRGENRRKNVFDSLVAIDEQIRSGIRGKKYIFLKPNGIQSTERQLGSTQPDTVRAILDYLAPRFKLPIVFGDTGQDPGKVGLVRFGWDKVFAEYKSLDVKFEIPNEDQSRYGLMHGIDYDMHLIPIRLGTRFVDPDAFVISAAIPKTHNFVVATMTVKNIVVASALSPPPGATAPAGQPSWLNAASEKRKFHVGVRAGNYNMYMAILRMLPVNWGLGIVDGYEGMEGNGPGQGTPVPHRIALASTDFIAVDRVSLECMGIDASWPGYLNYAYQAGLGQWDLSKIDLVGGVKIAEVQRKYRLHADTDVMLEWRGPMLDLPPNLGRNRHPLEEDLSAYV